MAGFLALVASFLAWSAWNEARLAYLRASDPARALALRPHDAGSLGRLIDQRMQRSGDASVSAAEIRNVRAALAERPLSRVLLRILGLEAEGRGNSARAEAAIDLSVAVSRRDALTQLWLIERSVGKNDMNGAIRHYNAALSVHPELGQALFPILGNAISHPEVRAALVPYVRQRKLWATGVLDWVSKQGNPADAARLGIAAREGLQDSALAELHTRIMSRLAEQGDFMLAKSYAKSVIPNFDPKDLDSLRVVEAITDRRLGALGWALAEQDGVLTSANDLGGFDVDIDPLARAPAASRTMLVTGGSDYRLSQTVRGGNGMGGGASLKWHAYCLPGRASLWEQTLPVSQQTRQIESIISVPRECKGLNLVLIARGSEGQESAHVTFEALDLRPSPNR